MSRAINAIVKVVEAVLAALLLGMVIMVATNVVLRYGFNRGLTFSEEMSRYFFVWLTFIGAVLAFKDNGHIGVETLVSRFNRTGRLICMAISNALILFGASVFFYGTWMQHPINASMTAAVVNMSMIWVYGIGYFTSVGIGLIALYRLFAIVTGRVSEEEIARFAGDPEVVKPEERAI
ncbi:TRAP transporter small permease [Pelagibacterium luteolum]|uniref:TRAP transporter small permease protein n=1 Tax=Pelagibacterium luteolum TaxID=440168 RepID=A0A1G7S5S0_9HYPH|nr:TRAP transporter small permease [Pelagibacterium luteolum]SDG18302.1 TRAP-type C4-dicarboxylate transport system, small permease component [Pelagibacterium luteolum]